MNSTSAPDRTDRAPHRSRPALGAVLVGGAVALAAIGTVLAGCTMPGATVRGSGAATAQTRAVASFSGLDLAGSNNVTVMVGRPQSVTVRADANLIKQVTTRVIGGILVIGETGSFTARSPMSVDVTVPSLAAIKLSGEGRISVTGIGASGLAVTVSGSGLVSAAGTATRLDVSLSGTGQAQLGELTARDVHAVVAGSGLIEVTATNSVNAAVPGSGTIIYHGNPPKAGTSVTGTGAITRG